MDKGLFKKYKVINNETAKEVDGEIFILKPAKDMAARKALHAYADATDNEELAKDLRRMADYEFTSCGCREAFCGHLFGGYYKEREVTPCKNVIHVTTE